MITPDDHASSDLPGRLIDPSILSPYNTNLIKNWMMTCQNEHSTCLHPTSNPRRLLHVGDHHQSYIKLHDFAHSRPRETLSYAALSYVWGGKQKLQTRVHNLNETLNAIQIHELPEVWPSLEIDATCYSSYLDCTDKTSIPDNKRCYQGMQSYRYTMVVGRCPLHHSRRSYRQGSRDCEHGGYLQQCRPDFGSCHGFE